MRGQERRALHLNFRFLAELENGEGGREESTASSIPTKRAWYFWSAVDEYL